MAREAARIISSRWTENEGWRALTMQAQWCYDMLCSQSKMTLCGVLDVKLAVWSGYASDVDVRALTALLEDLEAQDYIAWDQTTDEIAVRSFTRSNEWFSNTNWGRGVWSALKAVQSPRLQRYVIENLPAVAYDEKFRPVGDLVERLGITPPGQLPRVVEQPEKGAFEGPSEGPSEGPTEVSSSAKSKSEWRVPTESRGRTLRERGENPRALGTNPRARGTNPRALGTNPNAGAFDDRPAGDPAVAKLHDTLGELGYDTEADS